MTAAVIKTPVTHGAGPKLPTPVVIVAADATEATPAMAVQTGAVTETAPASDTASSGLNGRLQRIAQRLTSLIALVPASLGAKAASASLSVIQGGLEYETVAASQSTQAMGATGATGDYLSHVWVQPTSTAPGVVTVLDNAVEVAAWPGGSVGADLKPFPIVVGALSVSGAWKITTGANVKVTAYGDFT